MRATKQQFEAAAQAHRREIVSHCYRMLGSFADAEDTAQETFTRAWQALETFSGKASLRTWLFRIATNACLDALRARPRRALPIESGEPADPADPMPRALESTHWIGPFPDAPDAEYAGRESIMLAFVVLLHELTPRQRAVLLARDVLGFDAAEVAEQLDSTVPAIEALLHRARKVMRRRDVKPAAYVGNSEVLARYLRAWTDRDATALSALLKEDSVFSMPPQPAWFRGRDAIAAFLRARVFVDGDRWQLAPTRANGAPAFGVFRARCDGPFMPHAIHVLDVREDAIASITCFLDPDLLRRFVSLAQDNRVLVITEDSANEAVPPFAHAGA